jgi:hypothetical protein
MDTHDFVEYPRGHEYWLHCKTCGKDMQHHDQDVWIPHYGELRKVPRNYNELLQYAPLRRSEISESYIAWGALRYERGSREYQRDSPYGRTNACYLPETDTIKDVEEELLDAFFNILVLYWKMDSGASRTNLRYLLSDIAGGLYHCGELRRESIG